MKKIIFLLLLFLTYFTHLHSQADTLYVGIQESDTLIQDTTLCYPYSCPVQKCYSWQLPLGFDGVIDILSTTSDTCEIIVTSMNDSVHFDSCAMIQPASQGQFSLFFQYGANAQISVCNMEAKVILITAKPDTSTVHKELPPPFILLDTLCSVTSIQEPQPTPQYYYIDPYNFQKVSELLPNRYYLRRERQ